MNKTVTDCEYCGEGNPWGGMLEINCGGETGSILGGGSHGEQAVEEVGNHKAGRANQSNKACDGRGAWLRKRLLWLKTAAGEAED